jgi:hypothetical protein
MRIQAGWNFRKGQLAMHPTVKPVALVADAIKDCSKRGGRARRLFGQWDDLHRGRAADCVVADAVVCEPVSTPNFPANREKNREYCKILAAGAPESENNGVVTGLPMVIPCSTEQGIISAEQGILVREQAIFFRLNSNSSPD